MRAASAAARMKPRRFFAVLFLLLVAVTLRRRLKTPPSDPELGSPNAELEALFPDLMPQQVAILLLNSTQQALPVKRSLESVGVPFTVTRDLKTALRHRLVFVPGNDRPVRLEEADQVRLKEFASRGGILILQTPLEHPWPELTGLKALSPKRTRRRMAFLVKEDPGFVYLDEPEEREIPLAAPGTREGIWTVGLLPQGKTKVLAVFPDTGETAMLRRDIGAGAVYTLGADLRDLVVRPQIRRHFEAHQGRGGFEPAADVWALILRAWYERYTPSWIRARPAPAPYSGWLLLTHNLGEGASLEAAEAVAAVEKARGARATFFVRTQYASSASGLPFDSRLLGALRRLRSAGHELASSGVSASPDFEGLPMGSGDETMNAYAPETDSRGRSWGASLLGELMVSKSLLGHAAGAASVTGFRGPQGPYPSLLDLALKRAGYRYDSSFSSADCLTHFPFRLMKRRGMARESGITEWPVAAEGGTSQRVLAIFRKIAANEGAAVWSLTPRHSRADAGLLREVLDKATASLKPESLAEAWRYDSLRRGSRFWLERGGSAGKWTFHLGLARPEAGLSFELGSRIKSCVSLSKGARLACRGSDLTVADPGGAVNLSARLELE
ncbi:MAG: hypothetical protein HY921_06865 [Elusimicrobia bacterium]|nr:hypothetical protein [Elusimicrobiota bacterium]